jgi:hypothetical protein
LFWGSHVKGSCFCSYNVHIHQGCENV